MALVSLLGLPRIPGTNINLTVPYAAEGKGPTFNTLGEADGTPVVEIEGEKEDKTSGNLNMTTVSVRTNLTLAQALGRWIKSDDTLVPLEQVLPKGQTPEQVFQQNAASFAASESNATTSAMNYLHRPLETSVLEITDKSPAQNKLRIDDVVTKVDDKKITLPAELADAVKQHKPGDKVTLTVRRDGKEIRVPITLDETPKELRHNPHESGAFLGVTTVAQPAGDLKVRYNLNDVGGPSAGLMFSLAVVDKLSPGELSGGKFVAGTGTIDADGNVGPIGGITHKIRAAADAGAETFLVPAGNCQEAQSVSDAGAKLVKVDSLDSAVKNLEKINKGEEPETCS